MSCGWQKAPVTVITPPFRPFIATRGSLKNF
jgi:hypothetical protein